MTMVSVFKVMQIILLMALYIWPYGYAFAITDIKEDSGSGGHPSLSEMIKSLNETSEAGPLSQGTIQVNSLSSVIENNTEALTTFEGLVSEIVDQKDESISAAGWAGILGLFLSVCKILYDIRSKNNDKRSSKRDNFWLREVIFPKTIEPLDKAILNNDIRFNDFSKLTSEELQEFIDGFENLRDQVGLVTLLSPELLDSIDEAIDRLISVVANRAEPGSVYNEKLQHGESLGDPFLICYKNIIGHFMDAHERKEHQMVSA